MPQIGLEKSPGENYPTRGEHYPTGRKNDPPICILMDFCADWRRCRGGSENRLIWMDLSPGQEGILQAPSYQRAMRRSAEMDRIQKKIYIYLFILIELCWLKWKKSGVFAHYNFMGGSGKRGQNTEKMMRSSRIILSPGRIILSGRELSDRQ